MSGFVIAWSAVTYALAAVGLYSLVSWAASMLWPIIANFFITIIKGAFGLLGRFV